MEFMELVAMAFEKGCGITFEQAVCDSVAETRERRDLYSLLQLGEFDESIAYRAGHIEMGELFNALPEDQALKQAGVFGGIDPFDAVVLEHLGESLIDAAAECLPDTVRNVALMWQALSLADQRTALQTVYDELLKAYRITKTNQELEAARGRTGPCWHVEVTDDIVVTYYPEEVEEAIRHLRRLEKADEADLAQLALDYARNPANNDEDEDPKEVQKGNEVIANYVVDMHHLRSNYGWFEGISGENDYPAEGVLPRQYGKLGEGTQTPNCLGMSIALLAFARLAGAPVLLASQIEWAVDRLVADKLPVYTEVHEAFEELGGAGTSFHDWSSKELTFLQRSQVKVMDFHYGVVLQVNDGSWWHLDPYQRTLAELDADWGIPAIHALLEKYAKVLPGLTIVADDGGALRRSTVQWSDDLRSAIEGARTMMQVMSELPVDTDAITRREQEQVQFEYYLESPSWLAETLEPLYLLEEFFEERLSGFSGESGELTAEETLGLMRFQDLRLALELLGFRDDIYPEEHESEVIEALARLFLDDDEFRRHRMFAAATIWLRRKLRLLGEEFSRERPARLDPAIEVSLPDYSVALAVVNHLRSWTGSELPGRLLLEYSSSQVYWHEAVDLSEGYERSDAGHPDVLRAEQMVRSLRYTHRACDRKLTYLAHERAERNQHGRSEPTTAGGSHRGDASPGQDPRRDLP